MHQAVLFCYLQILRRYFVSYLCNPSGKVRTMTYDPANNDLLTINDPDPNNGAAVMTYYPTGALHTYTDPLGHTTTFEYNNLDQLTKVTDHTQHDTRYTPDHKGNRLSVIDANSKTTDYQYNFNNQLTEIKKYINNVANITALSYSGSGCSSCSTGVEKLTSVTDAKNQETRFEYNQAGNLVKETDYLGKSTTYTYDVRNNLETRTSPAPDSKTITYVYYDNNRLHQKQYTGGNTTYQYDDAGNMTYAGNATIAYTMEYDAFNRLHKITDSNDRVIEYHYNADGNRSQMITPDSRQLNYTYNDNGNLYQITTPLGNFTFTDDAANRRATRSYPNGTISTYSYDTINRLTGIQTTKDATTIEAVTYPLLDNVGNRMSKTQNSAIVDYTYDDIYRLTSASPTGTTQAPEAYTYDAVGNRLTSTYELTPSVNETTTYGYDDENRLTSVQITRNSQTKQLTFAYDPFGRRIRKTVSPFGGGAGEVTNYVYDGQNIILEYDQAGTITTRYTHGPSIDEPLAIEIPNATAFTPYYYHADGLGSITALSNASGNIVQRYEYDSFGNQTIATNGGIKQPFTFTAREYDAETGMYFYRARYYDPKAGRFITRDPISFAGGDVNLYAYVSNNPVNWSDPLGLKKCCNQKELQNCIKSNCPKVPPAPPGANINDNIENASKQFQQNETLWFYNQVKNKGPWDYKQQGSQYQDFGNFNYGATGAAGFSSGVLLRMAGRAQRQAGTSNPAWGSPWGSAPYGDDPADQQIIKQGIDYNNCKSKCESKHCSN